MTTLNRKTTAPKADAADKLDLTKTTLDQPREGAAIRVRTSLRAGPGSSSGGDQGVKTG